MSYLSFPIKSQY